MGIPLNVLFLNHLGTGLRTYLTTLDRWEEHPRRSQVGRGLLESSGTDSSTCGDGLGYRVKGRHLTELTAGRPIRETSRRASQAAQGVASKSSEAHESPESTCKEMRAGHWAQLLSEDCARVPGSFLQGKFEY